MSKPLNSPYQIVSATNTGVTATKVYKPDGTIAVHANQVSKCPTGFPAGYYWLREEIWTPKTPPPLLARQMDAEGSNTDSQNIESHVSDFYVRDDIHLTADNPETKNIPHTEKKAVPSQE